VRPKNENKLVEEEMDEEYVEHPEEIHMLQGENNSIHITKDDYEHSLNGRK
jgi:hypothetical protein